jgi:hypothetical protein
VGNLGGYTIRTNEKNERVKLENFRVNFVDSNLLSPDPKVASKVVDAIFSDKRPKQNDEIHEHTRRKAEEELLTRIGNSRKGTEMEQTPWYTMWK